MKEGEREGSTDCLPCLFPLRRVDLYLSRVGPKPQLRYTATLVNSLKTTRTGVKAPFVNTVFSMPVPAGVAVKSSNSYPKLATTPTVDTEAGVISWDVGTLEPCSKVKVTFKLTAPSSCTTPAPLSLQGLFAYTDAAGPQTAQAFLKEDLYVWARSCASVPKCGAK